MTQRQSHTRVEQPPPRKRSLVRDLSMKHKLMAVIMLTCVSALLLSGAVFVAWEWRSLRRSMVRDLSSHAEILANACRTALSFRDPGHATEILGTMEAIPSVVAVCVYTDDGELFAVYTRDTAGVMPPPGRPENGHSFQDGFLTLAKPVLFDGRDLGTVCLRTKLDVLYERLRGDVLVITGVFLLSACAAYLISARLQRVISSPILYLASVANFVSEKKKYGIRATYRSNDETGLLVQAFNEMLEQIQQRDAALVKANEQLEARVRARTAELTSANESLLRETNERRRVERALAKANEHLADTVRELRRSNKELQDFAYVAAHDLKVPLRGIGTLADWITCDYTDKLDEQGKRQLGLLKARVSRMNELIDSILRYAEVGRTPRRHEQIDLNQLIAEVIAQIKPPEHVQIQVQDNLPVVVSVRAQLAQVFQNLIVNAIKHLDKPQGRIAIGCRDQDDLWKITVTDNGPGIEAKYFEKIFQMFQTLAARDESRGTGMGLAIVKKIVELHGGSIAVESEPGQGSTFLFTLPQGTVAAERRPAHAGSVK